MSEGWVWGVKPGVGWCLFYGAWGDPEQISLVGFDSKFDAWAFVFAHLSVDVSGPMGEDRRWTNGPAEVKPKQMRMW